jgi:hypothetical protein
LLSSPGDLRPPIWADAGAAIDARTAAIVKSFNAESFIAKTSPPSLLRQF